MRSIPTLLLAMSLSTQAESLQDELDAFKAEFEKKADQEKIDEYNKGIQSVIESGMIERALKAGDKAPDFTLKNATGKDVTLSTLLKDGPVVLTWYRGSWCPYCNIALQSYQANLPKFKKAGARLVALTPELPDKSLTATEKHGLEFEVLSDVNNEVAGKFKIVFKMTPWVERAMRDFANLKSYNGDSYDDATLPLSATYVIAQDGTIAWAFLDAEYRNRATPEQILAELAKLDKS